VVHVLPDSPDSTANEVHLSLSFMYIKVRGGSRAIDPLFTGAIICLQQTECDVVPYTADLLMIASTGTGIFLVARPTLGTTVPVDSCEAERSREPKAFCTTIMGELRQVIRVNSANELES